MADKEYIERGALIENVERVYCTDCNSYNGVRCRACWVDDAVVMIEDAPAADVVSKGVYEQVQWERDMAMQQLEEHGIPFGGTADNVVEVVRCKDCKHWQHEEDVDFVCTQHYGYRLSTDYCSYGERKEQT